MNKEIPQTDQNDELGSRKLRLECTDYPPFVVKKRYLYTANNLVSPLMVVKKAKAFVEKDCWVSSLHNIPRELYCMESIVKLLTT